MFNLETRQALQGSTSELLCGKAVRRVGSPPEQLPWVRSPRGTVNEDSGGDEKKPYVCVCVCVCV